MGQVFFNSISLVKIHNININTVADNSFFSSSLRRLLIIKRNINAISFIHFIFRAILIILHIRAKLISFSLSLSSTPLTVKFTLSANISSSFRGFTCHIFYRNISNNKNKGHQSKHAYDKSNSLSAHSNKRISQDSSYKTATKGHIFSGIGGLKKQLAKTNKKVLILKFSSASHINSSACKKNNQYAQKNLCFQVSNLTTFFSNKRKISQKNRHKKYAESEHTKEESSNSSPKILTFQKNKYSKQNRNRSK